MRGMPHPVVSRVRGRRRAGRAPLSARAVAGIVAASGALLFSFPGAAVSAARAARPGSRVVRVKKPKNTVKPSVSGSARVGQVLTESQGSWEGSPTGYSYTWELCNSKGKLCAAIAGASQASYEVPASELGDKLQATVTAQNSAGAATAKAPLTAAIAIGPPRNLTAPTLTGTPEDGQTLEAGPGVWAGSEPITYAYNWQSCNAAGEACANIPGATGAALSLGHTSVGSRFRVALSATNAVETVVATSQASGIVAAAPPSNTRAPEVIGTDTAGATLTASTGAWSGTPPFSFSYEWQMCDALGEGCVQIPGAESSSFTLQEAQVGGTVRVIVTASSGAGSASGTSAATAPVAPAGGTAAVAWGRNYPSEQLGAGYKVNYEVSPVTVLGLTNIKQMAIDSDSSVALLANGTVRSWGGNLRGQVGDGSYANVGSPQPVLEETAPGEVHELQDVTAIAAAGSHVMALLEDGRVLTWGGSELGERGNGESGFQSEETAKEEDGTRRPRDVALEVPGLSGVKAIAAGGPSDYAVLEDGTVMAWGANLKGMLGIGESSGPERCKAEGTGKEGVPCSTKPMHVCAIGASGPCPSGPYLEGVTQVSGGAETSTRIGSAYALLANGTVVAFGNNNHGQLGDGGTTDSSVPVRVCAVGAGPCPSGPFLEGATAVAGGNLFALALLADGEVAGWGGNADGQIGGESSEECSKTIKACSMRPKLVAGLRAVTSIQAGVAYSLAVSGGTVYAFGDNERAQLGLGTASGPQTCGTTPCARTPTAIAGLGPAAGRPVASVAAGSGPVAGEAHSFAVLSSGAGPAPLVSVKAGHESLEVIWTFSYSQDKIRWRKAESTPAGKEKEQRLEAAEQALEEARAAEEGEAIIRLEAEIKTLQKEIKAEEKWSKTVTLEGPEAESCSPVTPCHLKIEAYEGEKLNPEPYLIQVNTPAGELNRTISGTPEG